MNFKESKPIYLQIADKICDDIVEGVYPSETRIPSVREYAAMAIVNPNTVMRTYEHLQMRGIIFNRRGIGYYVDPSATAKILEMRREVFLNDELPFLFSRLSLLGVSPEELTQLYSRYLTDKSR